MPSSQVEKFLELPQSQSCRLVDFEDIEIQPGIVNGTYFLIVSGKKPSKSMSITLRPMIYVRQPDYWTIEVTGCFNSGLPHPGEVPYTVSHDIGSGMGKKGIEIVGASKTVRRDVP